MSKIMCRFLNENGYDAERENALEIGLIEGKSYEYDRIDIDRCSSDLYIKGFDRGFNSVMFEYYKDGKVIDIVDYGMNR